MEKLSEDSQFGMTDNVEAEIVHNKKVLKEKQSSDHAVDNVSMSDIVEAEINS